MIWTGRSGIRQNRWLSPGIWPYRKPDWREELLAGKDYFVITTLTGEDIRNVMGKTMDVIAGILFPDLAQDVRGKLLERCCVRENDYLRANGGRLYEGVRDTFLKLRESGYEVCIVSNCQKGYVEAFLDYYQLWDCVDDIECYGNNLKQKGENIRLVADRRHLAEAVYVGDIQGDYEASVKAGVGFIHAAYGFGTVDAKVERIRTLGELPALVHSLLREGNGGA